MCPTISDPAAEVTLDTDVGAKLTPATGDLCRWNTLGRALACAELV